MKIELTSAFKKGIIIGLVFWASLSFGQIDKVWTIQNIAGNGGTTFTPGLSALENGFNTPTAMTVDGDGNIYFSVTAFGQAAIYKIRKSDNILVRVLTDVSGISGLAFDKKRNVLYFSMGAGSPTYTKEFIWRLDMESLEVDSIAGIESLGIPESGNLALEEPIGLAGGIKIHPDGDHLYYSCRGDETLGLSSFIQKIGLESGDAYTTRVVGIDGEDDDPDDDDEIDDNEYPLDVKVKIGLGLGWDSNKDLYFAEGHHTIKKITGGQVFNVAGTGSMGNGPDEAPATETSLNLFISGFVIDENNTMFLCDDNNKVIRRVQLTPNISGDPEIMKIVCGTGEGESADGLDSGDLTGTNYKLAKETNIKAYDIIRVDDSFIFTDDAKRLRQVFICDYPTLTDIAVSPESICVGDSVTLTIMDPLEDAEMWNWYVSDECSSTEMPYGHGQSIKLLAEDDFNISVSASGGCLAKQDCLTESFALNCKEFYNTFTPNGDGKNDFFEINTVQNYPLNTVSIYNRWGVLIDEIDNYDNLTNVWRGTFDGDLEVNSGTYFFTFESGGETIISGWIELIR